MSLRIPPTASNLPEWIRRAAVAVNALLTSKADIETRVGGLETFATLPFAVNSITLHPVALPASPVKGMTVYDTADDKVKTWDGSAWQAHW